MKRLTSVLAVVVAVVVVLVVAKNVIAKTIVVGGVKAVTGLTLSIDHLDVGLLSSAVGVKGLKLHNPAGFPEPVMIDLPELYVNYDPAALLAGKVHLEEVRVNLREFVVIRNQQGAVNLDALKPVQQTKAAKGESAKAEPPKPQKASKIQIDVLELNVGKVVYKDYTGGGEPKVQEFSVNIHERYEGINNPYALGSLIVSRALMHTAVAKLANVDLAGMQALAESQLGQAAAVVGDAARAAQRLQGQAADTARSTAGALKKLLPIGNDQQR